MSLGSARRAKVTIRDVAKAAGTSPSTVSRVLTGSANVSPQKRAAVLRAVEVLHYSPNLVARSLKTKLTYSLGLIINDIQSPFYSAAAKGVETYAAHAGYCVMLCDTGEDPRQEKKYLDMLRAKKVDGIVFVPTGDNQPYVRELADEGVPLVQIDRKLAGVPASAVLADDEQGAHAAVSHLIKNGYRRIAMLNFNKDVTTAVLRQQGYCRALSAAGLPVDGGSILRGHSSSDDGYSLTMMVLDRPFPPDALFAASSRLGIGALRAIKDRDLRIPDDIAIVIFDDVEAFSLMTPPVTAVYQPAYDIGWKAAEVLIKAIESGPSLSPQQVVLETQLIVRGSSLPKAA